MGYWLAGRPPEGPPSGALLLYMLCTVGRILGVSRSVEHEVLSVLAFACVLRYCVCYCVCTRTAVIAFVVFGFARFLSLLFWFSCQWVLVK